MYVGFPRSTPSLAAPLARIKASIPAAPVSRPLLFPSPFHPALHKGAGRPGTLECFRCGAYLNFIIDKSPSGQLEFSSSAVSSRVVSRIRRIAVFPESPGLVLCVSVLCVYTRCSKEGGEQCTCKFYTSKEGEVR